MFAFIFTLIFIWLAMWAFFKFMYPKPPKQFMPQKGDIITPRECDFCGYPLAEYRGVMESIPGAEITDLEQQNIADLQKEVAELQRHIEVYKKQATDKAQLKSLTRQQKKQTQANYEQQQQQLFQKKQAIKKMTTWFFCNYEHQANFHQQQKTKQQS